MFVSRKKEVILLGNITFTDGVLQNSDYEKDKQQFNESEVKEIIVPIGIRTDGESFFQNISEIPHLLVCGVSGSGKTSFIQTVITYLAINYRSEEVNFLIYDSKYVDYSMFNTLPHIVMPVIKDDKKAIDVISQLSVECNWRLKQLTNRSVRDIFSYNKQCDITAKERLPHLFVVLDDFSSMRLDVETTALLKNILSIGRAVGIHFIFVTSAVSPSKILVKDILTYVPGRICFCVSNGIDSKLVVDKTGAENLSIPGELIFKWRNNFVKCQGMYTTYEDIQKTIKKVPMSERKSTYAFESMKIKSLDNFSSEQSLQTIMKALDEEELFLDAVDVVFEAGQASVQLIQRRLRLGYARSARLIDRMEECEIIGSYAGAEPREINMTWAQWQTIKNKILENSKSVENAYDPSGISSDKVLDKVFDDEESPDIIMRNFPRFNFNNVGLRVNENQIEISIRSKTTGGSYISTASFNGKSVAEITYRKPHMLSCGYIQFGIKPNVEIINNTPHLKKVTEKNLQDILKIKFNKRVENTIKSFVIQISQDIGILLNEL